MKRLLTLAGLAVGLVLVSAGSAAAHPLGNFTVNHYNGIALFPDRVEVLAIVDIAEIPTAQELPAIDTDGSGTPSAAELSAYAATQCGDVAAAVVAEVDGVALRWTVGATTLETVPGVAELPTLRLTCPLSAPTDLAEPATVSLTDSYREDRVGWHEITAIGDGVRLLDPPVPGESLSDELRSYPDDLLLSPLDQRSVELRTEAGSGVSSGDGNLLDGASADPFTRFLASADRYLEDLIGPELTPLVGALAILLAVLLGAGHALLPGHGKTVMAAYLAGRRGSRRDAVTVGATVTVTHTAGVLVLGLLISLSSAIAGEQVLRWLGVVSGLLVAGIGAALL
ncbi:MAG: nickel transporter, partial [Actinomycetota bacterium]|nr:nickel transporter [Actinomycetota bacterium]